MPNQDVDRVQLSPLGSARHQAGHEAGEHGPPQVRTAPGQVVPELHVCMGLNACTGQGANGSGPMAGMGDCATVAHVCHGANNCRGQGGCGYSGSDYEQAKPGEQACKYSGSCASPINISRMSSAGPNKGKSVWQLARFLFEKRMYDAGVPFGPSPGQGSPDDLVPSYESPYQGC
ncbi:MAG TPA: hypothetical protein VFW71_11240 [Actinomycetota bacterium]|nr:hypothetical protein [Actinomycetota bacterium]